LLFFSDSDFDNIEGEQEEGEDIDEFDDDEIESFSSPMGHRPMDWPETHSEWESPGLMTGFIRESSADLESLTPEEIETQHMLSVKEIEKECIVAKAASERDAAIAGAIKGLTQAQATSKRDKELTIVAGRKELQLSSYRGDQKARDRAVDLFELESKIGNETQKKAEAEAKFEYDRSVAEAEAGYTVTVIESEQDMGAEDRTMDVRRETNLKNTRGFRDAAIATADADQAITEKRP